MDVCDAIIQMSMDSRASVTLPLIEIHRPSRRLTHTENYTGDTEYYIEKLHTVYLKLYKPKL